MLRKISHGLLAFLYPTLLISGAMSVGLALVFGSPTPIKQALDKSGVYNVAVDTALSKVKQDTEVNSLPVTDPGFQAVIKQTIPPDYLKSTTENVITGTYDWLNGKTAAPSFSVDLTKVKTDLANNLAIYGSERLASLPACASNSTAQDFDPITASCVPAGYNAAGAATQIRDQVLQNTDLFKQTNFSAQDLKNERGEPVLTKYQAIPALFKMFVWGAWITLALALLVGVGMVFTAETRRRGVRGVGISSAVCGALLVGLALGLKFAFSRLATQMTGGEGADIIKVNAFNIVKVLTDNVANWWLWFGIALVVIGVAMAVIQHFTGPRAEKPPKADKPEKEATEDMKLPPYLEDDKKPEVANPKPPAAKPKSKKVTISG